MEFQKDVVAVDTTSNNSVPGFSTEELLRMSHEVILKMVGNRNDIEPDQVPEMIQQVYRTYQKLNSTGVETTSQVPAVPINESVTPDYIICLEDGKKLQMLKRHLNTMFQMTPEEYRRKWGLPDDYPMTAPNYSKRRSELAKMSGLGRTGRALAA